MDGIDSLDRKLIRCLQDNPRAQYRTIGQLVGVSESTVKRRVTALINRGIIRPAMIARAVAHLGYSSRVYIQLKVAPQHARAAAATLESYHECLTVALTTGSFDIICLVALPDLAALQTFLEQRIASIEGVIATDVNVCTDMLKTIQHWRSPLLEQDGVWPDAVSDAAPAATNDHDGDRL